MAQVDDMRERVDASAGSLVGQYNENEDVTTTTSFVNALDIDARGVRESVIVVHNKGSGDVTYDIIANPRPLAKIVDPTGTNDDDKGWVEIKSATAISSGAAPSISTFSNPYTRVLVRIKHVTSSTDVNIWHKGQN